MADGQFPAVAWDLPRIFTMIQRVRAPEMIRIEVKLAASTWSSFSATRHSKEFPAKAIMANNVNINTRFCDIT